MTTQEPKDIASRRHVVFSPVEWGQDEVTGFLIAAEKNAMARFANRNDDFSLLVEVDKLFRLVVQNIDNTEEWFEAFFLLRSHSAFLATVRLAVSGQASESYATSRQCIEFALYGFYLFRHKNLQELWLSRTESKHHSQKVRDTFKSNQMFAQLITDDPVHGKAAKVLYERTINLGAHPNEESVTTTMNIIRDGDKQIIQGIYLHGDDVQTECAVKTAAQVGVTTLCIFRNVFKHRYDIIGITDALDHVKKSL